MAPPDGLTARWPHAFRLSGYWTENEALTQEVAKGGGADDELGHRGAARFGDTSDLTRDLGVFRVELGRIDQRERAVDTFAHARRHARKHRRKRRLLPD